MSPRVEINADQLLVLQVYGELVLKYAPPLADDAQLRDAVAAARDARSRSGPDRDALVRIVARQRARHRRDSDGETAWCVWCAQDETLHDEDANWPCWVVRALGEEG
jgi:hypothetical protein